MKAILGALAILATPTIHAATIDIDAFVRGGLNSNGVHATGASGTATGNYIAGTFDGEPVSEVRNFFVFDLSGISGPITGATLQLTMPSNGYTSGDASETYTLFDFLLLPSVLSDPVPGIGAFADLGSGTSFATQVISAADNGTLVNIVLNASAIAAINASLGSDFALGGALTTLSAGPDVDEFAFGFTGVAQGFVTRLSLTTDATEVPEPSSALLVIGGLGLLGLARRRWR